MAKFTQWKTIRRVFGIVLLVVLLGGLVWGIQWATYARPPLPEALEALSSSDQIQVSTEPWLTFAPTQSEATTGFIFYPGGRINPQGYAPLMNAIALEGYLAVVPEMPINMAVFNPNVANEIIDANPQINHWVIGGHSVGGTMAAQFTDAYPEKIAGLVIWASYPADNINLSAASIPVGLIYGTLDPVVNDESVGDRKYLLPEDTIYTRIEGGDHHQFGTYKITPEEHHATISSADQQEQIISATLDILTTASQDE